MQIFNARQRGTDDDDRLTERDHDERLDPLRRMGSIDVPFPSRRATQPRYVEADRRGKEIEGDHECPQYFAEVAMGQPTDDGQRSADERPDEEALEVAFEGFMTRGVNGKKVAPDLHRGIRSTDGQSGRPECLWECSRR